MHRQWKLNMHGCALLTRFASLQPKLLGVTKNPWNCVSVSIRHTSSDHVTWKSIPGFSKYEASINGHIRSKQTERLLKGHNRSNFKFVRLKHDNGSPSTRPIHRLVATTFDTSGMDLSWHIIAHKDKNPENNALDNLQVMSRSERMLNIYSEYGETAVVLSNLDAGKTFTFKSVKKCRQYCVDKLGFSSYCFSHIRDQPVKVSKIDNQRYTVTYVDKFKYNAKVNDLVGEKWKPIWTSGSRFNQTYYVSNYGRVKVFFPKSNVAKPKKIWKNLDGYHCVDLSDSGRSCQHFIHRLVAEAFIPQVLNYNQVDHIDGIKSNNTVENLRWVSSIRENMQNPVTKDKFQQRRVSSRVARIDPQTGKTMQIYDSAHAASKSPQIATSSSNVLRACRNTNFTCRGFKWEFIDK